MKIDIQEVEVLLRQRKMPQAEVDAITSRLIELAEAAKPEKEDKPKTELYAVTPDDTVLDDARILVVKAVKGLPMPELVDAIRGAAAEHNEACKARRGGKKKIVDTIDEAVAFVPAKYFKARGIKVMQKSPVRGMRAHL